jgi:hypothetical protein
MSALQARGLEKAMICRCGHEQGKHHHDKSCTALIDEVKLRYCKCSEFREATQIQGDEMSKTKKAKSEGRKPTLAPFVDAPFKVYMTCDGKERDAMVLSSGIIKYKEKEFTSPSGFANAVIKELGAKGRADGWKSVYFNKDGERVMLNTLRGGKSPLKLEAPKREKKAKANGNSKPKRIRKPRVRKPRAARQKPVDAAPQAAEAGAAA